jgi:putative membrane protein
VARSSLRGEGLSAEIAALFGPDEAARIAAADHMPSYVALKMADLLREACDHLGLEPFMFLQIDRERAALIDHLGACERILKTPLPKVYAIKIRRFIAMFLITFPFALLHRVELDWLVPIVTMFVAYPLLALDRIGVELQNPFATTNLSHLPLESITAGIARNLQDLLRERQSLTMNVR